MKYYCRRESVSDRFNRVDLEQVKIGSEKFLNEVKIGDNEQGEMVQNLIWRGITSVVALMKKIRKTNYKLID
ncbi:hypothetical protein HanPI659440_Chr11g0440771 [Helianthus annuus]|nr:hypothetical protein HanPI659440_Chr11g0440771 [Helianthus annuus]